MRLAAAIAVVAVAWAAALYVHQRHPLHTFTPSCVSKGTGFDPYTCVNLDTEVERTHPSWEDPAAVLLALGGLAVAVGIARPNLAKPS